MRLRSQTIDVIEKTVQRPLQQTQDSDSHRGVRSQVDGVPIAELIRKFGSPLYVYSERTARQRFQEMRSAFECRYPNVELAWSYKTNYLSAICSLFHAEGATAEVVSKMEYELAKSFQVVGTDIVFNGPHKPFETLKAAVRDGARIHIDHWEEIDDLDEIARQLGVIIPVGIRLNMDVDLHPQWSRFGFNLESGEATEAVKRIYESGRLRLNGLHTHVGTSVVDSKAYARAIEKLVQLGYQERDRHGCQIETIDIGGGFTSGSRPKDQAIDREIPKVNEYAESICEALLDCLEPDHRPRLIIESGRGLIDDAGFLVTSVLAAKRLANGKRAYVADAGINLLFSSFWYDHHVELEKPVDGDREESIIHGPLCMNNDTVVENVALPKLQRGDRLVLSPVGAYNLTQSMQFIDYRPNAVLIREDGQVDLIQTAESKANIDHRDR